MSLVSLIPILWLWTLPSFWMSMTDTPDYQESGIASTFRPGGKWNNGKFACGGDWVDESLPICAHRTLPCGTWVSIENKKTGDTAWCQVRDRGPYGAITPAGKWVVKRPNDPETADAKYRGVIDLGPSVAESAGTKGWGRVVIRTWHRKTRDRLRRAARNNNN